MTDKGECCCAAFASYGTELMYASVHTMGSSRGDVKRRACDVEEAKEGLENEL